MSDTPLDENSGSSAGVAAPVNNPTKSTPDANIDPVLLYDRFIPARTESGDKVPERLYLSHLEGIKTRQPLLDACSHFNIRHAKRDSLGKLRAALVRHWYASNLRDGSQTGDAGDAGRVIMAPSNQPQRRRVNAVLSAPSSSQVAKDVCADTEVDDETLVRQYDVGGGIGQEIFGALDSGGLEEIGEDEDEYQEEIEEQDLSRDDVFRKYQTQIRVSAAQRWEANRRAGGRKTQKSVAKSWKIFVDDALSQGKIRDEIVDEHSLLLFIEFSANRCRRDRRGDYIPNSRIGASQIKKEFFGALRIRKVQDAQDPTLAAQRPATTVHVYDAVKTRMDEALRIARDGLIPADDAPDIVANTFLAALSDETLKRIRYGTSGWIWQAPNISRIAEFCFSHLGWTDITELIKMFRKNLWEGVIYRMLLSPHVSFSSITSVLHDGKSLSVTFTDLREKSRQTAKAWPFNWCRIKFADDKLTEKALANLPRGVRDRYAIVVSNTQAEESDPNPLSVWIPVCCLPQTLLVYFRHQLILRRKLPSMSSDSDAESGDLETQAETTANLVESSAVAHRQSRHQSASPPNSNSDRSDFIDLTNPDYTCLSGKGTQYNPILLDSDSE